jgi:hypothetical protein
MEDITGEAVVELRKEKALPILKEMKIRSHKLILLGRNKLPIKKYNHLLKAYNKFGRTCKHLLTTPIKDNQLTCNERGGVIKIKTACTKEPR